MQKNSALRFARIAVTAALITYILHKAGLFSVEGWQHLLDTFAHISLPLVLASIGVELLLILSSAFKWYMLLHSRGLPVSLWRLLAYYMIGMFFNLILPTSVGGDVVRMHELGRYTGRYADAVASVFIDRFSGMATLVVLALLAVVVNLRLLNQSWLTMGLAIAIGGVAFICWLIIDKRPFNLAQRLFGRQLVGRVSRLEATAVRRVPSFSQLFAKIDKFRQAVLAYKNHPGALWGALINSLIFYFLGVVNVWVSALAFGSELGFINMLAAVPIIFLIMNLPISIGSIGLMEFAFSFTLGLFGATPTLAISTALLIRAKSFLFAGIGGLLYPLVSDGHSIAGRSLAQVASKYKEHSDE